MIFHPPDFDVRLGDYSDERKWKKTRGLDCEDAAVNFVELHNEVSAIYPEDGDVVYVIVRGDDGVEHRIKVYAERAINYYGIECKSCT